MSNTTMPSDEELREKLAAIEHQRWADWQKWCHKVLRDNNPSPEIGDVLERWDRQIETPYNELSESGKQLDRDQVMRYWPMLQEALHEAEERGYNKGCAAQHAKDFDEMAESDAWHEKELREAEVKARIDELEKWQHQWFALATTVPRMQAAPRPLKLYVADRIATLTTDKETNK